MGKVLTNKILYINRNESIIITEDESLLISADATLHKADMMHMDEETVLVFDEKGNCIGNMENDKLRDLQ
ncbi:MAG: hypothetical protein JXR76_03010 [Deltaproteobacteria bacterium]|nr:hypothetical protein [Deltaproteobacteria bacterium]